MKLHELISPTPRRGKAKKDPTIVRVFHGSPDAKLILYPGHLYGAQDFGFAASYGVDRGRGDGFVHTLEFRFHNLLDVDSGVGHDAFVKFCAAMGYDYGWGMSIVEQEDESLRQLQKLGYDGLTGYDMGFRADFEQLPAWMVFDASTQVRILASVPVSGDDTEKTHAPD